MQKQNQSGKNRNNHAPHKVKSTSSFEKYIPIKTTLNVLYIEENKTEIILTGCLNQIYLPSIHFNVCSSFCLVLFHKIFLISSTFWLDPALPVEQYEK